MAQERAEPGRADWPELAAPHLARYLFAVEYARAKRVLDAGAGSGYGSYLLAAYEAAEVLGLDLDPQAVESAARRFTHSALRYVVGDCQTLEQAEGPFDLICHFETLEHLAHPEQFLRAAAQRLATDGLAIISTPDREACPPFVGGRPRNRFHLHEWRRDEFLDLLTRHFADVELRAQVQSTSLAARQDAIAALREGLLWASPLLATVWRKLPGVTGMRRPWKRLAGLAAPTLADYPIVPSTLAPLFGVSHYHVALCRRPRREG